MLATLGRYVLNLFARKDQQQQDHDQEGHVQHPVGAPTTSSVVAKEVQDAAPIEPSSGSTNDAATTTSPPPAPVSPPNPPTSISRTDLKTSEGALTTTPKEGHSDHHNLIEEATTSSNAMMIDQNTTSTDFEGQKCEGALTPPPPRDEGKAHVPPQEGLDNVSPENNTSAIPVVSPKPTPPKRKQSPRRKSPNPDGSIAQSKNKRQRKSPLRLTKDLGV